VTAGQFETAIQSITHAVALAERLDHPHSIAHALMTGLSVASAAADYGHLQKWAEDLERVAETYNFPPQRAVAAFFLEWGRAQRGQLDIEKLRSTFNQVVAIGPLTLVYVALFAEELLKAGEAAEGLMVIDHFIGTLKFPFGYFLPDVYRVRGECLAELGRTDEAVAELEQAGKMASNQGSELFALRAAIARARCCADGAQKASAMMAVEKSLDIIGSTPWPEIMAARSLAAAK
jgi:tetratricopeptide (TPR) repeat protein